MNLASPHSAITSAHCLAGVGYTDTLEAQLGFFPIEETGGRIQFESEGVRYHNLFDFFYFLEVIEEIKGSEKTTDSELAQKLFTYAIRDA